MQTRRPEPGDVYRHFKNKLYEVIAIAIHSETEEEMVVYQQKYGDEKVYVRPLGMFLSEIDHEKYPMEEQKYRFEWIPKKEEVISENEMDFLMKFLDAKDYREKLLVLQNVPNELDDRMITNMALSVDLVIEDGSIDARLDELIQCLKTKAKFECLRLY